ncbi:CDP-alcohol phosphatidyltransferase family protein [Micrococcales bacterium 31B]|nr:CDP-alcohol phosphatidyltransferase family protein [Micrococcales bacterium 31B]
MISKLFQKGARAVMVPIAKALLRAGVTPDMVTIAGTVLTLLAAVFLYGTGHWWVGSLVITLLVLADTLDGVMARTSGTSSVWGAFLDSTLDRIADAAIFGAVAYWCLVRTDVDQTLARTTGALCLLALALGAMVSYAKARAEGLGMTANVGLAERSDRLVAIILAVFLADIGLPFWMLTLIISVLCVLSVITVFQRMGTVKVQAASRRLGNP